MLGGMVTTFHYHTMKWGGEGESTTIRVAISLIGMLAKSKDECMYKLGDA